MSLKFQITSVLPSLTLYDNILLALQAQSSLIDLVFSRTRAALHEQVMTMLTQFRLANRAFEAAAALSHGQQQWLEIAMALAGKPKLLLLDEPTGGMSLEERRVTGELLQPIKQHCSLVIVEHGLDFIRDICDRLTVLDDDERAMLLDRLEQLAGDAALLEAHAAGRLVQQQQFRLARERHCDLQPLLLAMR